MKLVNLKNCYRKVDESVDIETNTAVKLLLHSASEVHSRVGQWDKNNYRGLSTQKSQLFRGRQSHLNVNEITIKRLRSIAIY